MTKALVIVCDFQEPSLLVWSADVQMFAMAKFWVLVKSVPGVGNVVFLKVGQHLP